MLNFADIVQRAQHNHTVAAESDAEVDCVKERSNGRNLFLRPMLLEQRGNPRYHHTLILTTLTTTIRVLGFDLDIYRYVKLCLTSYLLFISKPTK